jgi:hypothetical protein
VRHWIESHHEPETRADPRADSGCPVVEIPQAEHRHPGLIVELRGRQHSQRPRIFHRPCWLHEAIDPRLTMGVKNLPEFSRAIRKALEKARELDLLPEDGAE